ncbi:MAG: hypothetical protein IT376_00185 [Polyangiaceae bacterium]|nr:hypothetical protein [Polyangiaceae bacterium]
MTEPATEDAPHAGDAPTAAPGGRRASASDRWHAASAALLLVFLAAHAAASALALGGREAYAAVSRPLDGAALRALAEAAAVALLVGHAASGLGRLARAARRGEGRGGRARLLTGLGTAAFLAVHLPGDWAPRVARTIHGADHYDRLARALSTTGALGIAWWAALYLTGAALACAHAHLGLRGPGYLARVVARRAGPRGAAWLAVVLPLGVLGLLVASVVHLATGGLPGAAGR